MGILYGKRHMLVDFWRCNLSWNTDEPDWTEYKAQPLVASHQICGGDEDWLALDSNTRIRRSSRRRRVPYYRFDRSRYLGRRAADNWKPSFLRFYGNDFSGWAESGFVWLADERVRDHSQRSSEPMCQYVGTCQLVDLVYGRRFSFTTLSKVIIHFPLVSRVQARNQRCSLGFYGTLFSHYRNSSDSFVHHNVHF